MSQTKKLTPNLDQQSTKALNLTVLQRMDPFVEEILFTAAHVSFYEFNILNNQWSRKDVEGSLFVVKRSKQPRFQFIVMNRRNTDNLVENLMDFEFELKKPYLLYRNAAQEVIGIWFYNSDECEEVANLFNRILDAYPKLPPRTKVPLAKSEFEEVEPAPVITEGSLECFSAAPSATNAPEDPTFVNLFNTAKVSGNHTSNIENLRQPYHPATAISSVPIGESSYPPALLIPSAPYSVSSAFLHDSSDKTKSGSQVTNLLKPSSFFASPSSSSLLIPPISSSVPSTTTLHPSPSLTRPYGTPMLQPVPPSNPPPSLTPLPTSDPSKAVISREKVRDALLSLVQDDQFVDMMFQTLLKLSHP
ncbi:hypothetical protein L6164_033887 [Bauhinia variegata]|uniref:Uncharacterized protein n=1 Tax=Bauhinia variegata TaxID=167791 RepID=A0ACB9KT61_BAUVA|nr:hypothetical protein L6164_033887 [Bauhinia variegata]